MMRSTIYFALASVLVMGAVNTADATSEINNRDNFLQLTTLAGVSGAEQWKNGVKCSNDCFDPAFAPGTKPGWGMHGPNDQVGSLRVLFDRPLTATFRYSRNYPQNGNCPVDLSINGVVIADSAIPSGPEEIKEFRVAVTADGDYVDLTEGRDGSICSMTIYSLEISGPVCFSEWGYIGPITKDPTQHPTQSVTYGKWNADSRDDCMETCNESVGSIYYSWYNRDGAAKGNCKCARANASADEIAAEPNVQVGRACDVDVNWCTFAICATVETPTTTNPYDASTGRFWLYNENGYLNPDVVDGSALAYDPHLKDTSWMEIINHAKGSKDLVSGDTYCFRGVAVGRNWVSNYWPSSWGNCGDPYLWKLEFDTPVVNGMDVHIYSKHQNGYWCASAIAPGTNSPSLTCGKNEAATWTIGWSGPTTNPTPGTTTNPTPGPTTNPTPGPTTNPTPGPTTNPTPGPTTNPTPGPTGNPTPGPTSQLDGLVDAIRGLSAMVKGNSEVISEIKGVLDQRGQSPSCYGRRTEA